MIAIGTEGRMRQSPCTYCTERQRAMVVVHRETVVGDDAR